MIFIKYATNAIVTLYFVFSIVGCVNSPAFHTYENDDEIIISEKELDVHTEEAVKPSEVSVADEREAGHYTKEEKPYVKFSTANEYWKNALVHLQNGNEDEAKWALEQALKLSPNNKIAKNLMNQIKVDAINELGIASFEYKIQAGDSLSKLAKVYLNDPLKFYLLAKYNDISNPGHLVTGRTINIPGVKPEVTMVETVPSTLKKVESSTVSVNSESPKTTDKIEIEEVNVDLSLISKATESYKQSDYENVVSLLEDSILIANLNSDAIRLLVSSYYEISQSYIKEGNNQEAKYILLKAAEVEPDNAKVNMALIDMDETSEIESFYEKSLNSLKEGNVVEANEYVLKVLELNPYHKRAQELRKEITVKLIPHYYKHALMAQRKQKLDEAIELWDEVLALDENNENAKIYRNKALSLKMKLEQFAAK